MHNRREKKHLLRSLAAFIAALSLAGVEAYLLPSHPEPQIVMLLFVIFYVLFIEKRPLSSLGISARNMNESIALGLFVGVLLYLYTAITIIMFYLDLGVSDAFVYLAHNFNITPSALLHYIYIGFSEEIVFRGFLQRRFLESVHTFGNLAKLIGL